MTAIGTGYDLSATTYSTDGRIYQIEYATKAVDNSGTAIGVRCKDGIVLGVEKTILNKLLVEGTNHRVANVDRHAGVATAGLAADARQIVNRARHEAREYRNFYGDAIPGKILNERLSNYVQSHTLYGYMRPFGVSAILGVVDKTGPQLYVIEPSGISYGYFGAAVGKGRQAAKTELEKLKLREFTCKEAINDVARIIHLVHDDVKDKEFELELSWICPDSKGQHEMVPKELRDNAERLAKAALDDGMHT